MAAIYVGPVHTIFPGLNVVDVPRVKAGEGAGSNRERVAHGNIDRAANAIPHLSSVVDILESSLQPPTEGRSRGIGRDVLEQAANAARSIQRALGTSQDLDSRKIARVDIRSKISAADEGRRAVGHIVYGYTDCRIGLAAGGNASD